MKFRIFILFLLLFTYGNSQEIPPPPISAGVDSVVIHKNGQYATDSLLLENPTTNNSVYPKSFDERFQSKYKGPEYDYTTIKPRESLWQKIQNRIRKILESIFGEVDSSKFEQYAENIIRVFGVIIIGLVVYFLIKFLLGKNGNFFFSKKNAKTNIGNHDLHENIHEINFCETIENLERKKDYRSAVRYQFLMILKNLTDKKYISWNLEKTNHDYLLELKDEDLKNSFQELAYIFDYVWYGEFEVNEENYNHYKKQFIGFKI